MFGISAKMSSYSKWAQLFHGFSFGRRFGYMYTFFSNTLEELKKVVCTYYYFNCIIN